MNYCNGCHSLKYLRYQRMADDLKIPTAVLTANLVPPGSSSLDYIDHPDAGGRCGRTGSARCRPICR